jgi:hypothetical protein
MKRILLSALLACSLMSARAEVYIFHTLLNGANESPANASPGIGFGLVTYDDVAHSLQVLAIFAGLEGNTTLAHIHAPTPVPFGGIASPATMTPTLTGFPAGVTSGSYSNTLDLASTTSYNDAFVTANGGTAAGAEAALVAAMFEGTSYLNIHSSVYGGGEIRGFLTLVPEPSTFALAGLGAVGMAFHARRKKHADKS